MLQGVFVFCIFVLKRNVFLEIRKKFGGGVDQNRQSYEIKSPPWTILWFRILVIFYVMYCLKFETSKQTTCLYFRQDTLNSLINMTSCLLILKNSTLHVYWFLRFFPPSTPRLVELRVYVFQKIPPSRFISISTFSDLAAFACPPCLFQSPRLLERWEYSETRLKRIESKTARKCS